jgi:hypothetical protein
LTGSAADGGNGASVGDEVTAVLERGVTDEDEDGEACIVVKDDDALGDRLEDGAQPATSMHTTTVATRRSWMCLEDGA